jgi:hypothetical protein
VKAALLVAVVFAIAGATAMAATAKPRWRVSTKHAQQGSLRAEFSYRRYSGATKFWDHGRIKIWSGGRLIVNYRPRYSFSGAYALPALSIRQLDGTGPPEVIVTVFSGGAHCCWTTVLFTDAHRTTKEWGHFGAPKLRDVDGDGNPEFHGFDSRFAAAFGSFGGSALPAKVWSYSADALHDVTPAYPAEVQADMAQQYARYQKAAAGENSDGVRGALGAYAADGYTLGQGDAAMAVVQAAADAGETQGGSSDTDPAYGGDYVAALRELLRKLGYDTSAVEEEDG